MTNLITGSDAGSVDDKAFLTDVSRYPAAERDEPVSDSGTIQIGATEGNASTLSVREQSVAAKETAVQSREETADQRDDVAKAREATIALREVVAASREKSIEDAESMKALLESHILGLRQANEHLVLSTVQAYAMTEVVQKSKDDIGFMAHHDLLTGLPNRLLLAERIVQAAALARRHEQRLAVLVIDLDRFKTINDSLGHATGDALLKAVAQRLRTSVRITDTVSRQGGDEFVILLSEVTDEKAVRSFADKVCNTLSAPFAIADEVLHVGASIGISMYPDEGETPDTLIQHADAAMNHAKHSMPGRFAFFKPEITARAVERRQTEASLYVALARGEFALHYQAQVSLDTRRIIGSEALIRWHHPERGLLAAGEFVPIAESCGAIVPIGRWVLREACRQTRQWRDAGLPAQVISVNISATEFAKTDFLQHLQDVLNDTGLAPEYLELELTETALMADVDATLRTLNAIKLLGVGIAIDDFGTGYSSLSYLKQFPVSTLKIDQSFVADIGASVDAYVMVQTVIHLGTSLKHRVIAEGIETPAQLQFLGGHHCSEG